MNIHFEITHGFASGPVVQPAGPELVFVGERVCTGRALASARKEGLAEDAQGEFTCQFQSKSALPGQVCCSTLISGPESLRRATPELRCLKSKDLRADQ